LIFFSPTEEALTAKAIPNRSSVTLYAPKCEVF